MNISQYSITHRSVVGLFLVLLLMGGIYAFVKLGKREDSTFTIKTAVVVCRYEGATPEEVEQLVAIPLERELRTLGSVDEITSESHFGYAKLMVKLLSGTPASRVPQIWDELRRRLSNVESDLPEGAGPISVADDFGDVYGLYYALASDGGFSWSEIRSYARDMERALYAVEGVAKVLLQGEQRAEVQITISPATLAAFDIRPEAISRAISEQNAIVGLGTWRAGELRIELSEGTAYSSIADIENQLLTSSDGKQYRLGDIASVEQRYHEPSALRLRVDGRDAVAVAVAADPQWDIVDVGRRVREVLDVASARLPAGLEIVSLYPEDEIARKANNDFVINILESLAIVILLIMLTMGLRSGVVVGSSLLFSLTATLLVMLFMGEGLNRTSLAGFIIAMGMLVDNAIVVTDNATMLSRRGVPLAEAVVRGATEPRWGLLAATLIAIISFLPLQLAPSSVAEIIRPLFVVIALSLMISWLLSLTQVPAMAVGLLRGGRDGGVVNRSKWFGGVVQVVLRHRWATVVAAVLLFVGSLWAMGRMPQNFFPQLSKPYFRADVILPEGYDIEATAERLERIEEWLMSQEEVVHVSTMAGGSPPRYYLASSSYAQRPNYGNVLVELNDKSVTAEVEQRLDRWVDESMPDVWLRSSLFKLSPVPDATIEIGFVGDNIDTLRRLASHAMAIMRGRDDVRNVRNSWGNRVAVWSPRYSQIKGQRLGVERGGMVRSLEISTEGMPVGTFRENDSELPILLRTTPMADSALVAMRTMPVFSARGRAFSLEQAAASFDFGFRRSVIQRIDGQRVMKAQCDPGRGVNTIALLEALRRDVEREITLPDGYRMKLYGEEESREESNAALASQLPMTLVLIFIVLVLLFGRVSDAVVVVVTIPLIFVGVVLGLGLTGKMFDFFSLLGLLGLVGMNVKSAVILISRINEQCRSGVEPHEAVVRATADRVIPVVTASGTTVLGMVPLLFDSMFGGMAATIMGGLVVATLLVLVVLPAIYALVHNIKIQRL